MNTAISTHYALPALAADINAAHEAARAQAQSAMQSAIRAGELLNAAKAKVAHGQWEQWLLANCIVAPRTAQAYMRLSTNLLTLSPPEAQRVADLPLREAIRAISTSPDRPQQSRYPSIRVARRDDAERAAEALGKSATALRSGAKYIRLLHELPGKKAQALRTSLVRAIEILDRLSTDSTAISSEKAI